MANPVFLFALICAVFSGILAIPGGWTEGNVDDEAVQNMANFAVSKIDAGTNSLFRSKLMKLTRVETQVVAGVNYHLVFEMALTTCLKGESKDKPGCDSKTKEVRVCTATVWDQSWTDTRRLTNFKCENKKEPVKPEGKSNDRQNNLVGGATKLDQSTKEAQAAAKFAVEELNTRTNSQYRAMLQDIISVHRQTVAGFKYFLVTKLGVSTCENNENNKQATLKQCPINDSEGSEMCKFEVLHQAWQMPTYQLVNYKCEKSGKFNSKSGLSNHSKQPLLGGGDHDIGNYGMFSDFVTKFKKSYKSKAEEMERFTIFRENMKKAALLQRHENGTAKYGPTEFSDMSEAEFRKYYLTPQWDTSYDPSLKPAVIPTGPVPDAYDWRDHGAVTPVKNQEQCGSCWAFSTTGNIEGQWALRKNKLLSLSEQELVDCDKLDDGCAGGLPTNAYKEIMRIGGLETEGEYPYEAEDEKCKFKLNEARIYINGSLNISSSETDMAAWLAKNGPISIGINANAMQFYMGGVSHPWSFLCNPDTLDHGVLIVGYGVEDGFFGKSPYWIVKNSWGKGWGEKGYYRVYRGDGTCGVNKMPTSAVVD